MTTQQLWAHRWRMHCVLQLFRKPSPGNTDNDFGLFVCLLSAQMTSAPRLGTARTVGAHQWSLFRGLGERLPRGLKKKRALCAAV